MSTHTKPRLNLIHSTFGRVRVHLPDPEGFVASRIRHVPGVTFAESSKWTGNILVQFNPPIISEKEVLAEMLLAAEDVEACDENVLAPARQPAPNSALAMNSTEPAGYVTGLRRKVYQALGWASVGMAVVGFALPGIPGAPFVVLAGYFFVRSSPRSHAWLLQSRWFGPVLRDWEQHRAVRRSLKYTAVGLIAIAFVVILFSGLPVALIATILVFEVIGMTIVLRLRVVEPAPVAPALTIG
jgi:uncharacterized membrane protein YbaN (DUF454 family)